MWAIERLTREGEEGRQWEVVTQFPDWKWEDEAAVGYRFLALANTQQLDLETYCYRIVWN